jgi:glycosyltransferase involved in cell wall biosynthesis
MNEARNLPHVLPSIPEWVTEVILVDGHSVDDTVEVARSIRPSIRVIPQEGRGKGAALRTGFDAATGDIIVMLDADGSTDPSEIGRYVEALLQGADFAKGTRYAGGGGSADITGFRSLGNRVLSAMVNTLFGAHYTDLCYGYNAFWSYCLPHMHVDCDGFEVETQINIRVAKAGLKVCEVPSFEGKRIHGVSNLNAFRDGWRVLKTIGREWRQPTQGYQPAVGGEQWEVLRNDVVETGAGYETQLSG